jgi:hypothetical protein
MEQDVDPWQRNSNETLFELDVNFGPLLSLRTVETPSDHVTQHLDAESFRQLVDVSTQPIYDKILVPLPRRCQYSGPSGNSAHWSWFEVPRAAQTYC